ncbi:MAG: hypothetical protein JXA57_13815 [Armatimonadetes bacterium]|nr:hypothetical protein [Armatimonadota bacterium]
MKYFALIALALCLATAAAIAFPGEANTGTLDFIVQAREAGAVIAFYKTVEDCNTAFFGEQGINIGRCSGRFQECLCVSPEHELKIIETGILVSILRDRDQKQGIGTIFLPMDSLHFARALYMYPKDGDGEPTMTELFVWLK